MKKTEALETLELLASDQWGIIATAQTERESITAPWPLEMLNRAGNMHYPDFLKVSQSGDDSGDLTSESTD